MGTISVSLPSDGSTASVSQYNTPINTIVNAVNGNLDSDNLAANAVTTAKIADDNVTAAKMDWTMFPRFSARRTSNFDLSADAAFATITFDKEDFNVGSGFSSSTFTAPVAGHYFFCGNIVTPNLSGAAMGAGIQFTVNGSGTYGLVKTVDNALSVDFIGVSTSVLLNLAANDVVRMQGYLDITSGSAYVTTGTSFSGFLVAGV